MSNKTCIIVEDNAEDLSVLLSYVEKVSFLKVKAIANNYSDAVKYLLEHQVDILYLDAQLLNSNNLTGFDILRTIPNAPNTIIMSDKSELAVEAFSVGKSCDFLLKPFSFDRFLLATNRALTVPNIIFQNNNEKFVFFKMGRKFQKFNLNDILYLEAYGIYMKIYQELGKRPMIVNENITSIMAHLDSDTFIRIHKSYIININKLTSFSGNSLFIDTYALPIGISYKPKLDSYLKLFTNLEE